MDSPIASPASAQRPVRALVIAATNSSTSIVPLRFTSADGQVRVALPSATLMRLMISSIVTRLSLLQSPTSNTVPIGVEVGFVVDVYVTAGVGVSVTASVGVSVTAGVGVSVTEMTWTFWVMLEAAS